MLKLLWRELGSAAAEPTASLCGLQSGFCPLPNEIAFHLGQRSHHMEEEAATGGGGIDAVGDTGEVDATHSQLTDQFDQLAHRTTKAIQLPHYESVTWSEVRSGGI